MKLRLHQFLRRAGAAKKNFEVMRLIRKGRVRVGDDVVTAATYVVDTSKKRVFVDGEEIRIQPPRYFLVDKPRGYSCQKGEFPNVLDLLAKHMKLDEKTLMSLFMVGRLDRDTEGLIIVTNDGRFGADVVELEKEYEAMVKGELAGQEIKRLQDGVTIKVEGEDYLTRPARVTLTKKVRVPATGVVNSCARITLTEGKKRQVRLMFEAVGHPVISLKRVRIGEWNLGRLGNKFVVEIPKLEIRNPKFETISKFE